MAGVAIIALIEPRRKKSKIVPAHGNWSPGAWERGARVSTMGVPDIWFTKTRAPGQRVERYRKNLIANKIPFIEGAPREVPGYEGPVVEFLTGDRR